MADFVTQMIEGVGEVLAKLLTGKEADHEIVIEQKLTDKNLSLLLSQLTDKKVVYIDDKPLEDTDIMEMSASDECGEVSQD